MPGSSILAQAASLYKLFLGAKYGHDRRMLGLMLWPLIRDHGLVHDKYCRLTGITTAAPPDLRSHFGAGHENIRAVLEDVERPGIPRM
jgi:hypothetical protein